MFIWIMNHTYKNQMLRPVLLIAYVVVIRVTGSFVVGQSCLATNMCSAGRTDCRCVYFEVVYIQYSSNPYYV